MAKPTIRVVIDTNIIIRAVFYHKSLVNDTFTRLFSENTEGGALEFFLKIKIESQIKLDKITF
jgi:predicted nucleic acid-binding protein